MWVQVQGIPQAVVNLKRAKKAFLQDAYNRMYVLGLKIIMDAMRHAPVDSGNLRASAVVYAKKSEAGGVKKMVAAENRPWNPVARNYKPNIRKLIISAGDVRAAAEAMIRDPDTAVVLGFTAYYAYFVHEDLSVAHPTGQAKFLERAIVENRYMVKALFGPQATSSGFTHRNLYRGWQ